jgi:hypothetical protein
MLAIAISQTVLSYKDRDAISRPAFAHPYRFISRELFSLAETRTNRTDHRAALGIEEP